MAFCIQCGASLAQGAAFCAQCGKRVTASPQPEEHSRPKMEQGRVPFVPYTSIGRSGGRQLPDRSGTLGSGTQFSSGSGSLGGGRQLPGGSTALGSGRQLSGESTALGSGRQLSDESTALDGGIREEKEHLALGETLKIGANLQQKEGEASESGFFPVCPRCEWKLEEALVYCPSCGHEVRLSYVPEQETWRSGEEGQEERRRQEDPQEVCDRQQRQGTDFGGGSSASFSEMQAAGPGRELYRKGSVAHMQGFLPATGTLILWENQVEFHPVLSLTSGGFRFPISTVQSAGEGTVLGMNVLLEIQTRDGQNYKFNFGAGGQGERNRALEILRQRIVR